MPTACSPRAGWMPTQEKKKKKKLVLWRFFLAEPIFKIGLFNQFSMEPTFHYCEILKFWGLMNADLKI